MKKLIVLLLILAVFVAGCTAKTVPTTTEKDTGSADTTVAIVTPGTSQADISADINSISGDISNVNTDDNSLTPISSADLETD